MPDQDRQIRFLIPPVLFLLSLGCGTYFDPASNLACKLAAPPWKDLHVLIGAAVAGSTIPLGYLIGLISLVLIRFLTFWHKPQWDVAFSDTSLKKLWRLFGVLDTGLYKGFNLQAGSTFQHYIMPASILNWILRRWTTVLNSINCLGALLLSYFVAVVFGIKHTRYWLAATAFVAVPLLIAGCRAWFETERMMQFQLDFGPAIERLKSTFGTRLPELEKIEIGVDTLSVNLKDGRKISVPLTWYPKLKAATPEQRTKSEVVDSGCVVQWKDLDVSISVTELFATDPKGTGGRRDT